MAFNSIEYLIFLLAVVVLNQLLPRVTRLPLLLVASYYFYSCWNQYYLVLIVGSTVLDYFCARGMGGSGRGIKKWLLSLSLLGNLGLLFTFKYYNFFRLVLRQAGDLAGLEILLPDIDVILPVGISFYTLQTMSYTLDVYRGKLEPEKHFGKFALYVASFPQLVAGPIERATHLLPQMGRKYVLNRIDFVEGARLVGWGLFKKVVIADRLSIYVEWAFNDPGDRSNASLAVAGFLANVLIYADFSAYADIAIGSARMIGLHLRPNFDFPLFARSMPDFWRRWHISLHSWFLDYVYYPLGGSRVVYARFILNVFLVFLLSGLWHGAAWNFVVWSVLHFLFVFIHIHVVKLMGKFGVKTPKNGLITFLRIALMHLQRDVSMYFFFIPSVMTSVGILTGFFEKPWSVGREIFGPVHAFGFALALGFTAFLFAVELMHFRRPWQDRLQAMPRLVRWGVYILMLQVIMIFGIETDNPFIYFQF